MLTSVEYLMVLSIVALTTLFFLSQKILSVSKKESIIKMIQKGKYNEAMSTLDNLLRKTPNNSFALYYLGETLFQQENYEKALPYFKKLTAYRNLDMEVNELKLQERLGETYLRLGLLEEAQKEFLLLLKRQKNYKYFYKVGEIFYRRNYKDNAAAYYKKALQIYPTHAPSLFRLGEIYYQAKNSEQCLIQMQKCLEAQPNHYKAHYYIGMYYKENKEYEQAMREFKYSIRETEFKLLSYYHIAECYVKQNENQRAIEVLKIPLKDLEIEFQQLDIQEFLSIRYLLSNLYENERNISEALEQWDKIIEIDPDYKNTQEKIHEYDDFRDDPCLNEFLSASNLQFEVLCERVVQNLGLKVLESEIYLGHRISIRAEESQQGWEENQSNKQFIRIYRINEIGESMVRETLEEMKKAGSVKAYCISSGFFTPQAIKYSENRPIELYSRPQLSILLNRTNPQQKSAA